MGKYKFGKKEETLPFRLVKQKVINANLRLRDEAFFWLLYYCGVRKSEAYERVAGDFKKSGTHLIVDFHRRKKGGAEVPPLRLPLNWYGVDKIVLSARIALTYRSKEKAVYVYKDGKRVRVVRKDR
jgi:site-specific recombinase XerD